MSEFITPELLSIDDMAEGVYAGSGGIIDTVGPVPTPDEPAPTPAGCWINWQCRWTGHDHGGHSVCNVTANHCSDHSGERLVMNFITNFPIQEVKNASGLTISNVGTYTFTLIRNNHFNPTESIGFNFEIVTSALLYDESGNPLHGAIGTNNDSAYYCKVASYTCG